MQMERWTVEKSAELYGIRNWGDGYFDVNQDGHVIVKPDRNGSAIDLVKLVNEVVERGIDVPVLVRFDGIIRDRVRRIHSAFDAAIKEFSYAGKYRGAYPIKVNQQRHVVDVVRNAGRDFEMGLEVGSKPELIAVLAIHDTPGAVLLCNGYKDREYIELALLANRLGRRSVIIVEQLYEIGQILNVSEELGIDVEIGLRIKPVTKGSGRWEASSGERAKFGLSTTEIMLAIEELQRRQKTGCVKLLHFHIGSQITSISAIKRAMKEATRMYTELHKFCPTLCFIDVGGGLAVDYDGSRTNFESSMNYTLEEYARDIVYAIGQAVEEAGIPAPDIISESGRALVAHHSVLVAQAIDVAPTLDVVSQLEEPPSDNDVLHELYDLYRSATVKNCQETLHDAISVREEIFSRFLQGNLSLAERAYADKSFWHLMAKLKGLSVSLKYCSEDLQELGDHLVDIYFGNFSLFQSLPDSWAIGHLFPIVPIDRLTEEPTRRATIADISCDSDGKIERFIDLKDVKKFVQFHEVKPEQPYFFAVFLVGAYQEILGDLHNLFGDTNAVHVDLDRDGKLEFNHVVEGDTVREVLSYVEFDAPDLLERLRVSIEKALAAGKLSNEQSAKLQKRFKESLDNYTYLKV